MDYCLIHSHPCYIRIIVTNVVEKNSLLAAMSEVFRHPDYLSKHSLWDFSNAGGMGMNIEDLGEIVGVLRLFRPQDKNFANKVALVVPDQMHQAMAILFISLSKLLPFKYKVFNTTEAAIAFLIP